MANIMEKMSGNVQCPKTIEEKIEWEVSVSH